MSNADLIAEARKGTEMNGRQIRDAVRDGIITPEQAAKLERQPKRATNGWQRAAAIVIASLFVAVIIGGLIALLMLIVRAIGSIL